VRCSALRLRSGCHQVQRPGREQCRVCRGVATESIASLAMRWRRPSALHWSNLRPPG
jgi:hypothetical protein